MKGVLGYNKAPLVSVDFNHDPASSTYDATLTKVIDGTLVNGSAATVGWLSGIARRVQTGFLYTYAFWMVIGLAALLGWFLLSAH